MILTARSIEDFDAIREKALKLGAKKAEVVDLRRMYTAIGFCGIVER